MFLIILATGMLQMLTILSVRDLIGRPHQYSVEGLQDIADLHDQVLADGNTYTVESLQMNLSLQEVDHILTALETMSSYDIARAREQVINGVSDHPELIQNLRIIVSVLFDMKEFDYDLDYKKLDLQIQRLANFIVLEGENKGSIGTPLYRRYLCSLEICR